MTNVAAVRNAVVACALAVCLAAAGAQPPLTASKTYYTGSLTRDGTTEPAALDLSLYDDGFAFGRLQLPGQQELLYGSGRLMDGSRLRMVFRQAEPGEDPWWAAEIAHLRAQGAADHVELGATVAVLAATREYEWYGEGGTLAGTLRYANGEPAEVELTRLATAARWSFENGRVSSTAILPRFPGQTALNERLYQYAVPAMTSFAEVGLSLDDSRSLGWAWWREERVELAGAADRFLSLLTTVDDYTGGAHPNSLIGSYLLEVGARGVTPLSLGDLFAGEGWIEEVSERVLDGLRRQEAMWVTEGEVTDLSDRDLAVFTLDVAGVTFHFSPYLMGPYVQGTFRVTLPYADIAHLFDRAGPLPHFESGAPVALPPAAP